MYQDRRTMGANGQFAGRYPRQEMQGMAEEKAVEETIAEVEIQAEECGCAEDCDCGCDDKCGCNDGCGGNNMLWLVLLLLFWK